MNINIQTVHFDADEKLLTLVENKVSKLQTFHDNITRVEVFLKLDNLVHNIKDKVVEIKVHIPKQDCFVKASTKSFELSFDQALDSVINQLKKKKDRVALVY
jgi:putative sigma-54 modulation protein